MGRARLWPWLVACACQGPRHAATTASEASASAAAAPAPSSASASPCPVRDGDRDGDARFDTTRVMIATRDGVRLETALFTPSPLPKPLPMLLMRTPYGIPEDDRNLRSRWYAPLRQDGYIFVLQNLRGRFGSEGVFVMDRPPRTARTPTPVDETTDACDTIEWLVQHVPGNSGRVGMIGGSYAAWAATMALLEPHPALAVVSQAASPADQFVGDDYHHNGAFRLSYCFEFSAQLESTPGQLTPFAFDRLDSYELVPRARSALAGERALLPPEGADLGAARSMQRDQRCESVGLRACDDG